MLLTEKVVYDIMKTERQIKSLPFYRVGERRQLLQELKDLTQYFNTIVAIEVLQEEGVFLG